MLLTNLGEFIVSNVKLSAINLGTMEARTSKSGDIRLLKANKSAGRGLSIMSWKNLDALNFSKISKVRFQFLNTELSREVLNKEVALLFRVLESLLLSHDDTLSLKSCQSRLNIKLNSVEFGIIELLNCLFSRSEASIRISGVFEAYESKLALSILGVSHH